MTLNEESLCEEKEVRLFPSHHIRSDREAEPRATAAFLAVVRAVSKFGKRIVSIAGGPGGRIGCYPEVPIQVGVGPDSRIERPDGIIRATWGKKDWAALVEVKVGENPLDHDQVERYHKLAYETGINALITVSNQAALPNGLPPGIKVKASHLKKVPVAHLSWERLLSEAQVLTRRKSVADRDQEWILEEWVRYLVDPASRIIKPPDLGPHWHRVVQYARQGNLGACKSEMQDVVERWDAFLRKTALRLRAKLGAEVRVVMPRAERTDPAVRLKNLLGVALNDQQLSGTFRVPHAAGDMSVVVLLPARSVQYVLDVKAPTEGRPKTQLKWIIKQLASGEVPDDLVVHVDWGYRVSSQAPVVEAEQQIEALLWDSNKQPISTKSEPRCFYLRRTTALAKGKGRSTAGVLEGIAQGMEDFYRRVVEKVKPYVQKAPQMPREERDQQPPDVVSREQAEGQSESATATPSTTPIQESAKQGTPVGDSDS